MEVDILPWKLAELTSMEINSMEAGGNFHGSWLACMEVGGSFQGGSKWKLPSK